MGEWITAISFAIGAIGGLFTLVVAVSTKLALHDQSIAQHDAEFIYRRNVDETWRADTTRKLGNVESDIAALKARVMNQRTDVYGPPPLTETN